MVQNHQQLKPYDLARVTHIDDYVTVPEIRAVLNAKREKPCSEEKAEELFRNWFSLAPRELGVGILRTPQIGHTHFLEDQKCAVLYGIGWKPEYESYVAGLMADSNPVVGGMVLPDYIHLDRVSGRHSRSYSIAKSHSITVEASSQEPPAEQPEPDVEPDSGFQPDSDFQPELNSLQQHRLNRRLRKQKQT